MPLGPFRNRTAKTFFAVHPGIQLYPRVDIQDNSQLSFDALSWSKADQEESNECDPMNRCQDAECKEGRWMKEVSYNERVTVNPLSVSPVRSSRI